MIIPKLHDGDDTSLQDSVLPNYPIKVKALVTDNNLVNTLGNSVNTSFGEGLQAIKVKSEPPDDFLDDLDHIVLKERKRTLLSRCGSVPYLYLFQDPLWWINMCDNMIILNVTKVTLSDFSFIVVLISCFLGIMMKFRNCWLLLFYCILQEIIGIDKPYNGGNSFSSSCPIEIGYF